MNASSAGNIKIEVYAKKLEVNISSSGDVTLSGEAETLNADLSSAGDLEAYNLKVKEADISASSAGDARINVSEKINARASSAGDISYQRRSQICRCIIHQVQAEFIKGKVQNNIYSHLIN